MTAPPDSDELERLRSVFGREAAAVRSTFSEWFYRYHADLYVHRVPFDVYVGKARLIRDELGDARRVLDLGAGFGVYACLLRALGVPEVVALDYHADKPPVGRRLAEHAGLDGVTFLQGDALALPFRPGTFDGALALASLSHIREPERALAGVARVLRPGGRLYVFEDNNSSFPGYEKAMSRVWEGAETGRYPDGVPSEKRMSESFLEIRRSLIRERNPDLPAEAVEACARATRGLYGRRIDEAVKEYRAGREIRNPRIRFACHPVSGEFEEYPLNPPMVEEMLRNAGFSPRLRSPHAGPYRGRLRLLKRFAAGVFRLCPPLLRWTSPTFSVAATRR